MRFGEGDHRRELRRDRQAEQERHHPQTAPPRPRRRARRRRASSGSSIRPASSRTGTDETTRSPRPYRRRTPPEDRGDPGRRAGAAVADLLDVGVDPAGETDLDADVHEEERADHGKLASRAESPRGRVAVICGPPTSRRRRPQQDAGTPRRHGRASGTATGHSLSLQAIARLVNSGDGTLPSAKHRCIPWRAGPGEPGRPTRPTCCRTRRRRRTPIPTSDEDRDDRRQLPERRDDTIIANETIMHPAHSGGRGRGRGRGPRAQRPDDVATRRPTNTRPIPPRRCRPRSAGIWTAPTRDAHARTPGTRSRRDTTATGTSHDPPTRSEYDHDPPAPIAPGVPAIPGPMVHPEAHIQHGPAG